MKYDFSNYGKISRVRIWGRWWDVIYVNEGSYAFGGGSTTRLTLFRNGSLKSRTLDGWIGHLFEPVRKGK